MFHPIYLTVVVWTQSLRAGPHFADFRNVVPSQPPQLAGQLVNWLPSQALSTKRGYRSYAEHAYRSFRASL